MTGICFRSQQPHLNWEIFLKTQIEKNSISNITKESNHQFVKERKITTPLFPLITQQNHEEDHDSPTNLRIFTSARVQGGFVLQKPELRFRLRLIGVKSRAKHVCVLLAKDVSSGSLRIVFVL